MNMKVYAQGDTIRFLVNLPEGVSPETDFAVSIYQSTTGRTQVAEKSAMTQQENGWMGVIPSEVTKEMSIGSYFAEILIREQDEERKILITPGVPAFKLVGSASKRIL